MRLFRKIISLSHKHKILVALVLLFLLLIPLGIIQLNNFNEDREKVLEEFYQKQNLKKANLEQTYEQILEEEAIRLANEEKDQVIIEKIDKNFKPNLPACSRLTNRINIIITNSSCSYRVRALGTTTMAVVFISEKINNFWSNEAKKLKKIDGSLETLSYINTFLSKESKRYDKSGINIELSFFGPYKISESLEGIYYRDNRGKFLEVLSETSGNNKVQEQNFDLVHYIYLSNSYGGSAFRRSHRAFTNTNSSRSSGVFIHETLHLFEAGDKYNDNDCNTVGKANPFDKTQKPQNLFDIMCRTNPLDSAIINKITAREIGWPN